MTEETGVRLIQPGVGFSLYKESLKKAAKHYYVKLWLLQEGERTLTQPYS